MICVDFIEVLNNANLDEKGTIPINNVSITTAAAVLAYARIHPLAAKIMLYILENNGTLYYTDTDSIVTDLRLPEEMVHPTTLGKLKLEHTVVEGYFIADKTYAIGINLNLLVREYPIRTDVAITAR